MTRGRKPTPTAVLRLRGSWRAKTRPGEPQPDMLEPECPAFLKGPAREAWDQLTKQLVNLGVVGDIDARPLARYCRMWQRWMAAEEFIEANGTTFKDQHGNQVLWPQANHSLKLADQLAKLEAAFGMTPSSRVHLTATKAADPSDPKDRFFSDHFASEKAK